MSDTNDPMIDLLPMCHTRMHCTLHLHSLPSICQNFAPGLRFDLVASITYTSESLESAGVARAPQALSGGSGLELAALWHMVRRGQRPASARAGGQGSKL